MAISTGIFKTPTGPVYDPSKDIERGFDKTTGIVTGFLERKAQDFDQQQVAFSEMYSNLGELEAKLQENYSGIQQQMIDSTREWLKEANKSGKRATDPEFQMGLSQRVGRIRGGMANADRNREQLKQAAELIKSDPAIVNKATALSSLYSRMNDPDFLISKNAFNSAEFLDDFVDMGAVARDFVKSLPTTGTFSDQFFNTRGDRVERTVVANPLIDSTSPVITTPEGNRILNIAPSQEFVAQVAAGNYGPRVSQQAQKLADQKYSSLPKDQAFAMAVKDIAQMGMGPNYAEKVVQTKEQIDKENLMNEKTIASINLNNAKIQSELAKTYKTEAAQAEASERWSGFYDAYSSGSKGFLGDYENIRPGTMGVSWETEKDKYSDQVNSRQSWSSLPRDKRIKIIEELGLSSGVPKNAIGKWDTDTDQAYNIVKEAVNQLSSEPTGLKFKEKTGTSDGEAVYEDRVYKIDPNNLEDDLIRAFRALENLRVSGTKYKPSATAGEVDTKASGFKSLPKEGFN